MTVDSACEGVDSLNPFCITPLSPSLKGSPMSVSLIPISSNHNEVTVDETLLVFSYSTLVGVRTPDGMRYKTDHFHSTTTSKHLNRSGFKDAEEVSPDRLAYIVDFHLALPTSQPQKG